MLSNSITLLGQIISVMLGFFSTYIIFDFMSRFGRTIYIKKIYYIIGYLLFTMIIFFSVNLGGILNLLITIIATTLAGHFLYNDKKIYFFYYSIFIVVLVVFQVIAMYIFQIIRQYFNINFYNVDIYIITLSTVTQFVNLYASRFFILCYKKKTIHMITSVQLLNFLVLPLFSIFYITTLMMYLPLYFSLEDQLFILMNVASVIALNIFVTSIFESLAKNNELSNKLQLYAQQSNMDYNYYKNLEVKYMDSRKIIHDMKNHLQTIEKLYQIQENDQAKQYTQGMYEMFDQLIQKQYTSNKVLNIIINDKEQKVKKYTIDFISEIENIDLTFIEDIDITTIFSNLLDNAIEGTKNVHTNKFICLKIVKFNEFMIINMANSIDQIPINDEYGFVSTKKNHEGLGLLNVKMVIEKYEGTIRMDYDDMVFKINIVIPCV